MSLGYQKGKYWVSDARFEACTKLPAYTKLLMALRKVGLSVRCEFSYTSQQYTAETLTYEHFGNSAQTYEIKHGNAFDPHPMSAIAKAVMKSDRRDLLISTLCLELEVAVLAEACLAFQERERNFVNALDSLEAVLDMIRTKPLGKSHLQKWTEVIETMGSRDVVDEDDVQADEYDRWTHLILKGKPRDAKPAEPDEDDDL